MTSIFCTTLEKRMLWQTFIVAIYGQFDRRAARKEELVREIHQLVSLRVRLDDSGNIGGFCPRSVESSIMEKVK